MSQLTNTDELLTIEHLKTALGFHDSDDADDDKLYDIVRDATTETMAHIRPYLDTDVKIAQTAFHELAVQCSIVLAKAHWFEHNFQLDKAKHNEERYEKKVESLITALKTDRLERDEAFAVSAADPLDRVYLPTERGRYISREFI